jgi:hypothetical protein
MGITLINKELKKKYVFNFDTLICSIYVNDKFYINELFLSIKDMQKSIDYYINESWEIRNNTIIKNTNNN